MTASGITVVIPTIPLRRRRLSHALASVGLQYVLPDDVVVQDDVDGDGAAVTRHRGLMRVRTPWVAFLDDDDWFYPQHLQTLLTAATEHGGADYVWSWYDLVYPGDGVHNENDPLGHYGKQWDDAHPTQTTITTLVRTELAQQVGFLWPPETAEIDGQRQGEDFQFTMGCRAAGARMLHVAARTWAWAHWGYNLSGRSWTSEAMLPIAQKGAEL